MTGNILKKQRRIILLMLFGFEVDILEIALKQQQDLVDKIFLVESTKSHRGVRFYLNISRILSNFLEFKTIDVGKIEIQ